jgi:hypothetical protein
VGCIHSLHTAGVGHRWASSAGVTLVCHRHSAPSGSGWRILGRYSGAASICSTESFLSGITGGHEQDLSSYHLTFLSWGSRLMAFRTASMRGATARDRSESAGISDDDWYRTCHHQ